MVLIAVVSFAGLANSGWSGLVYTLIVVAPGATALGWYNSRYVEPELNRMTQQRAEAELGSEAAG